jgi:hypothetical protein
MVVFSAGLRRNVLAQASEEFSQDKIPPYAILSHTWGHEEVSFVDLVHSSGTSKAGYRKIIFCGEQAARDGLRYFWVDTCCIDKRNNTELTKAINSMFRWYRNAVKCYVHLHDVSAGSSTANAESCQRAWKRISGRAGGLLAAGLSKSFSLLHQLHSTPLSMRSEEISSL